MGTRILHDYVSTIEQAALDAQNEFTELDDVNITFAVGKQGYHIFYDHVSGKIIFSDCLKEVAGGVEILAGKTLSINTPTIDAHAATKNYVDINKFTDADAVAAVEAAGLVLDSGKLITSADEDLAFVFGRCRIGTHGADTATFSHRDMGGGNNYAIMQNNSGLVWLGAPATLRLMIAGGEEAIITNNYFKIKNNFSFVDGGATVDIINTTFVDDDTSLMTSQAIKEKIENYSYAALAGNSGQVFSVATPTINAHAATKNYVDILFATGTTYLDPVEDILATRPGTTAGYNIDDRIVAQDTNQIYTVVAGPLWNAGVDPSSGDTVLENTSGYQWNYNGSTWVQISGSQRHDGLLDIDSDINYHHVDIDAGTNGQVLSTNGTDALSWIDSVASIVDDTTPQLGGHLDMNSKCQFIVISHDVADGKCIYMNGATPTLADADAIATMPCIGISLSNTNNTICIGGIYTTSGLTAGDTYYVGTDGSPTNTAPSGSGDIVQVIGIALSTTQLLVNISLDVLEIL